MNIFDSKIIFRHSVYHFETFFGPKRRLTLRKKQVTFFLLPNHAIFGRLLPTKPMRSLAEFSGTSQINKDARADM